MLRQPIYLLVQLSFVIFCSAFSLVTSYGSEVQPYRSYTAPEGTHYFALGLQAPEQSTTKPLEVVFLIDTSASQAGQARLDTLAATVAAINHLPEGTNVQVLAMDVNTEPLTARFAAKGSPELETALKTLHSRVPLGATDFGKGLETVRKTFETGAKGARRAVLYLGGGRSMAKTITPEVFAKESQAFIEQKIPFTACAIGLRTNFGFISAFANSTGGNLIDTAPRELKVEAIDEKKVDVNLEEANWEKIGGQIADSAKAAVVWIDPAPVKFPESWTVYPQKIQPIRSDRATILVGNSASENETLPMFDLTLAGTTANGQITFTLPMVPAERESGNNYLRAVVETAAKDGGAVMPLVGWDSLLQIQELFIEDIEKQISKADTAISTGNLPQAMVLLDRVLRAEPSNKIAQNMFNATAERMNNVLPNVMAQEGEATEAVVSESTGTGEAAQPAFVDTVITEQSVGLQKIKKEVESALVDANKRAMASEPDFDVAVQNLKLTQQMVRNNTALVPAERDALLDRLGNTLKQVENERYAREFRSVQEEINEAKRRSREETLSAMQEQREKAIQIFARFTALMDAEEYKPAWAVADEAVDMLPNHPAPYVARRLAQMITYIDEYEKLRHQRHIGFIESFMEAERSFIPIPDEPPFTYIDRDRWKLLSDYRKEKYSTIALSDPDESIKTIKAILESRDINLVVDETTTFTDLFRMIKDELRRLKMPDIHIDLDRKALQEAGEIRSDTTVAPDGFDHPRMRLRSTLNRLLSPHDLTYIIRDESLLITTVEESRKLENMIIKVYPIADILMLEMGAMGGGGMMGGMGGGMMGGMGGGMMGGMGGGMMGGMGGMGGGMMGGMGGMGGGMMGGMGGMGGGMMGGMGGMGGGMYSVPDEITRSAGEQTATTPSTAAQVKVLLQNANTAADVSLFWTNYFKQEAVDSEVVHSTVRQLSKTMRTEKKNADQIVALVEAAILSGNAQPWMYEALTLSLYFKGAPKEEVLRAALSAADYCENPMDLLNVGFVMRTALDLKRYAFPLYRQALENLPPKREFFAAALRLAEELDIEYKDEESLRWIALAILSQEWDGALGKKLSDDADDALLMLSNRLLKRGQSDEVQKLAQEIREAKLRDCVVTVEWTGDAGVDLMVREPSSSTCWFKSPRSLSGGLLKPHTVSPTAKIGGPSEVKKISYVCPKGFNGWYSLVLHKSWGTLANDLVKVAIETNVVPGENKAEGTAVSVDKAEGTVVNFALETGRRTESVNEAEQEVADMQMTVAQNIVNRNTALWRLADDEVLGQTTTSTESTTGTGGSNTSSSTESGGGGTGTGGGDGGTGTGGGGDGGGGGTGGGGDGGDAGGVTYVQPDIMEYLYGSRYVGYQPEVTLLSVGSYLYFGPYDFAVSPDRRYVLMRVNQQYSTLRSVSEYSTGIGGGQGGVTNTTGGMGGMGGGGMMGGMGGMGGGMMGGMGGMGGGMMGGMGGMGGGMMGGMGGY